MPLLDEVGKSCSSYYNLMQYGAQTNAEELCECPITRNRCVPRWPQTSNNSSPVRLPRYAPPPPVISVTPLTR
jgi:hypothetical protein